MKKRLISIITATALCLVLSLAGGASAAGNSVGSAVKKTQAYILSAVPSAGVGSVGGEWAVLALARGGADVPEGYMRGYYRAAETYISTNITSMQSGRYTEFARLCLAVTALGADVRSVGGQDILAPLGNTEKVLSQGINGAIWALIAIDSGAYDLPDAREAYITSILSRELEGGGWSLMGKGSADPDITGMALTALAKYQSRAEVGAATERALTALSAMQNADGGFGSVTNAESTAQVIVALCSLGISVRDSRFVKGGKTAQDALLSLQNADGSFSHSAASSEGAQLSTEQSYYALVALERAENRQNALFDMTDATPLVSFGLSGKNSAVTRAAITAAGTSFSDISGIDGESAILALASRKIIDGMGDGTFAPSATMTRAQFAAIVVRALGLPSSEKNAFSDVTENRWYFSFVNTASEYGIINGRGNGIFDPNGTITRQEAAVMVSRAAALCGLEGDGSTAALSHFSDSAKVASWARVEVAFCAESGIFFTGGSIEPQRAILRSEIAQMLYNLLDRTELL